MVDIYWQDAIDTYAQEYVNERKDLKRKTEIIVNSTYTIESIKPGDTVKIRNFAYVFDNVQVEKISYSRNKCIVYLDKYISFGKQIISLQ